MNFSEMRQDLLNQVHRLPGGPEALAVLARVRREFDLAIPDYKNSLSILSDTTYQDRKHFLLELIQNADDASFTGDPVLTFKIHKDGIELIYNENGFTVDDVIAITGTGASTKSAKKLSYSFIGEKGIGFKSVFALARKVEIESYPWHFTLSKENVIVPEIVQEGGTLCPHEGTRIRVFLEDQDSVDAVASELEKYLGSRMESFLFLQRLSKFVMIDTRKDGTELFNLSVTPPNRDTDIITLAQEPQHVTRSYVLFHEEVSFPAELVAERWERLGNSTEPMLRRLSVAASTDETGNVKNAGRLFCFLPTNVKLPVPLYLQIDGHTKADREQLHDPITNRWNRHLLSYIPDFLANAILAWRDSELADNLLTFIPYEAGHDQLAPVVDRLMERLETRAWVQSMDVSEKWVAPGRALIPSDFLQKWFEISPTFRKRAEKLLNKRFVSPQWTSHPNWPRVAERYGIRAISGPDEALILQSAKLPRDVFKEDHLVTFYRYLSDFAKRWRMSRIVQQRLLAAPIFPIGRKFDALVNRDGVQSYWVATRSRRTTGLEGLVDIQIVNTSYTVILSDNRKVASEERMEEIRRINERNELVRALLRALDVTELNDDTLLEELQVPYLLRLEFKNDSKLAVLRQIFEGYRIKRDYDRDYLRMLSQIRAAFFFGSDGAKRPLHELLLPPQLRLQPEDAVFSVDHEAHMDLPIDFLTPPPSASRRAELERQDRWKSELREFLLHCGVRAGPKFEHSNCDYLRGTYEYSRSSRARYNAWIARTNGDVKISKRIQETIVSLDQASIRQLLSDEVSVAMVRAVYQEWLSQYGNRPKAIWDEETKEYGAYPPPPGYFKVMYSSHGRRGPQSVLVRDPKWAGIDSVTMPIIDESGQIVPTHSVRRVRGSVKKHVQHLCRVVPIVTEGPDGYRAEFLDSLNVPLLTSMDMNSLWTSANNFTHEEILLGLVEFVRNAMDITGILLWDKQEKRLRPASDFRLGRVERPGVPAIEKQYGKTGRMLGELLHLSTETEATILAEKLKEAVHRALLKKPLGKRSGQDLTELFSRWSAFTPPMKREVLTNWGQFLQEDGIHEVALLWNDSHLAKQLRASGKLVVEIVELSDVSAKQVELVASELGFTTLDSLGQLVYEHALPLNDFEKYYADYLLEAYAKLLEPDETARLEQLTRSIGGSSLSERIFRTKSLFRQLATDIRLTLDLPYLDFQQGMYFVHGSERLEDVLARLLSALGFTTYRSAIRDLRTIKVPRQGGAEQTPHAMGKASAARDGTAMEQKDDTTDSGPGGHRGASDSGAQAEYREVFDTTRQAAATAMTTHIPQHGPEGVERNSDDVNNTEASNEAQERPEYNQSRENSDTETDISRERQNKRQDIPQNSHVQLDLQRSPTELVRDRLVSSRGQSENDLVSWNLGLSPDDESSLREALTEAMGESLKTGLVFRHKLSRLASRISTSDKPRVIDNLAPDPKAYLLSEYRGQCQVCGTRLALSNGQVWFNIYRIVEQRDAYWANRPFNIISLCPNCHALAKFGGGVDLSAVETLAHESVSGATFPTEVEEFRGDYYTTNIVFNGQLHRIVFGKNHLAHFAALFEKQGDGR